MPDLFSFRSYQPEMLDAPNIPKELLFRNLQELDFINGTLGGHGVTLKGIKKLVTDKNKEYHIVDIGCGGGDSMLEIARWARTNSYKVKITGVDLNNDAIEFTNKHCQNFQEINTIQCDYRDFLKSATKVDIVHCSLFCHHLKDDELAELFSYLNKYTISGFVINDLQRHWFAYYSIKILTRLFSSSVLVKNDAPLSVLRGFKRGELKDLLTLSGINKCDISWRWAFRYLIVHRTTD